MSLLVFAGVIHVIGVVLWLGGVAFMTTVVTPSPRKSADPQPRWALFEKFENRFALQAKFVTMHLVSEPLDQIWFQLAITVPTIFDFDLEVARKSSQ